MLLFECQKDVKKQKNNTKDSNVVPRRSTNLARQCLTSLSRREAVLSLWYGRSYYHRGMQTLYTIYFYESMSKAPYFSEEIKYCQTDRY